MSEKILLVDDDSNLLAATERKFHGRFELDTAAGGDAGLAKLQQSGPYAVVVADMQMPGLNGIQFLAQVKQRAPDTVRIMLTGNADLDVAMGVVNEGNIFRFLTKPCDPEVLAKAIEDGQAQHRLMTAEKELLNKTLSGSIKLLTDLLSIVDPQSFGRAERLRSLLGELGPVMGIRNNWEIHLAAMLAPVGYVTLPPETVLKARTALPLSETEHQLVENVPQIAAKLLANIPRLEGVAQIVRYQQKHYDGTGLPVDEVKGDALPEGARVLKFLLDLMELQRSGLTRSQALCQMADREGCYDPHLLAAVEKWSFGRVTELESAGAGRPVKVAELVPGMVPVCNIETRTGLQAGGLPVVVVWAGQPLNEVVLEKIRNFERVFGIKEPIMVECAASEAAERRLAA